MRLNIKITNKNQTINTMKTLHLLKTIKFPIVGIILMLIAFGCQKSDTTISTDITFYNPVFTDIYITIGNSTQTINPGSSVTFSGIKGSSASFSAYTLVTSSSGTQLGLRMTWSINLTLTGNAASYYLNIPNTYFFLYITNNSPNGYLAPLYVNYGMTAQTEDLISIPNDGVQYGIGYYYAYSNTEVRAYFYNNPSSYVYWDQGTNFTFSGAENQYVSLTNTNKKSAVDNAKANSIIQLSNISSLTKVVETNAKRDSKAVNLYCK